MFKYTMAKLVGILLIICSCAQDIVELTDNTFYPFLQENDLVFVDFYGAGCGNCKAFYPDFVKLSEMIKQKGRPFRLGKLEVNTQLEVADKLIAGKLPQLMLFVKGQMTPYTQDFSANNIYSYLELAYRKLRLVTVLDSLEQIELHRNIPELQVILLSEDPAAIALVEKLAEKYSDFYFYRTSSKLGLEAFQDKDTKLVLTKPWDEKILLFNGKVEESEMDSFIGDNERPRVMEFSQSSTGKNNPLSILKPTGIKGVVLFQSAGMSESIKKEFKTAASVHRAPNMMFINTDPKNPVGQRVAKLIKLADKDLPAVYIIENTGKLVSTRCEGEITSDNIGKCIEKASAQQKKKDL